MTRTEPCSTSAAPTGWSARGCTGHYSCAMLAAALTRAAPTPATCKPITCGIGFTAARRISRTWCCYARLITVPITTVNSRFSASAEAGSGSYASTGGCYPTTSTRDSSSPTRLRSNTKHADVTADAATTRWIGHRLDRHYAISVLAQRREQLAHPAS